MDPYFVHEAFKRRKRYFGKQEGFLKVKLEQHYVLTWLRLKLLRALKGRFVGYSLIEISIALVVIGVIIAGAIKGYSLIESARLKSVMMQVSNYRMAVQSFKDRYDAFPGNFSKASLYIESTLLNGSGSGQLSGLGFSNSGPNHEASSFWGHLIADKLVSDVTPRKNGTQVDYGNGLPTTRLGGGITVQYNPEPGLEGHWLIVGKRFGEEGTGALFTPKQALAVLKQFQNEDPLSGAEQVRDGRDTRGRTPCLKNGHLDATSSDVSCVLYFKID